MALSKSTFLCAVPTWILGKNSQHPRLAPEISDISVVPDSPSRPDFEPELGYCGRPRLRLLLDAEDASKGCLLSADLCSHLKNGKKATKEKKARSQKR